MKPDYQNRIPKGMMLIWFLILMIGRKRAW